MGALQPWHWVIVIIAFVLLFGAKKLPDAARSLGKSMRIFKSELKELQAENKTDVPPAPSTPVESERIVPPVTGTEQPSDRRPA